MAYNNKHYKTIKALSPKLTILFTVGLILLCVGTILYLFHPLNDVLCNARVYFYGVGGVYISYSRLRIFSLMFVHCLRYKIMSKCFLTCSYVRIYSNSDYNGTFM